MQPFNPFLRAFFASKLAAQCNPPTHYVLLVPSTDCLLSSIDADSKSPYADLVQFEDFLASHVIRIPGGLNPVANPQDWPNIRESKAKVKQYTTLNGKTIIIKDLFVYTNKGFKNLNQAKILDDRLYYADAPDSPQWLIYTISKPLLGTLETRQQALASAASPTESSSSASPFSSSSSSSSSSSPSAAAATNGVKKKQINSFQELLNHFPMISRQMQPGLDKLFKQFSDSLDQNHAEPSLSSSATTLNNTDIESVLATSPSVSSIGTPFSHKRTASGASLPVGGSDIFLTRSLETLVISAIDLFQSVDAQQLSLVADITNLSGPLVERMIERYMIEHVHENHLFPRICSAHFDSDHELESCLKSIADVDISQIGIQDYGTVSDKMYLLKRIDAGIDVFKKMNNSKSPQEMVDILLETEQAITSSTSDDVKKPNAGNNADAEKSEQPLAGMNADTLVSLLLIVVVRSQVRQLHARLAYMRDFVFVSDVESGQTGYALSTFEAVLLYLSNNSGALRKIGRTNRSLWQAVKTGNISTIRALLDPEAVPLDSTETNSVPPSLPPRPLDQHETGSGDGNKSVEFAENANGHVANRLLEFPPDEQDAPSLSNVFAFENGSVTPEEVVSLPKVKKRVSMDLQSMSSSSDHSLHSRQSTVSSSIPTFLSGEMSAEQLVQTHDPSGNSVFMTAIESVQLKTLSYLLQLTQLVFPEQVMEDRNLDGRTLLSTAVQLGHRTMVGIVLDYVLDHLENDGALQKFLHAQDIWGRSLAHYCFHVPYLITSIGHLLPWTQKDKNGQTPLFAMCRSYDHEDYRNLVESALAAARIAQTNSSPRLTIDDHVDKKGNTLLHVANDPKITRLLLFGCDSDPNAVNEKRFTPLMVATKYGRTESIRAFFNDPRTDLQARDLRGLTAVEVAKDDEVRNRMDDLVMLLANPVKTGRTTTIVRSFFVEDGTIRMVLKSGAANDSESITVTTCRRSLADFENLALWLSQEHPASWIPSISNFRSPFQVATKPSKQVLRDIQLRLDSFLQTLLNHPTFSTHELVWEFFLVPEFDAKLLAERTKRKAEARVDNLKQDYDPLLQPSEINEVEIFTGHAISQIRHIHNCLRLVQRRLNSTRNISTDLAESHRLTAQHLTSLSPAHIPSTRAAAHNRYTSTLNQREHSPPTALQYALQSSLSCTDGLLSALARPTALIGSINATKATLEKHRSSSLRSQRWPSALGLLDDARTRLRTDAESKADKTQRELDMLGRELRYTRGTVAGELAGWQEVHAKTLKQALKNFATNTLVVERERLARMNAALRAVHAPA